MKVISNSHRLNYEYDPALNFGFEALKTKFSGTLVISVSRMEAVRDISGDKYFLEIEEPNRFLTPYSSSQNREGKDSDSNFKKVFLFVRLVPNFFNEMSSTKENMYSFLQILITYRNQVKKYMTLSILAICILSQL